MIEYIIGLLAPHRCIQCRTEGFLLCYSCSRRLPGAAVQCLECEAVCLCPTPSEQIISATEYRGMAKELIHCLKFGRARAASYSVAAVMAERLPPLATGITVVHTPTAPARIRQRGYDQAELIAKQLAHLAGLPHASLLLRADSGRQVGKNRYDRHQQARAFFEPKPAAAYPKHVLLVDDVLTTGATLRAAAQVLHHAGVGSVTAVVFAAAKRFG